MTMKLFIPLRFKILFSLLLLVTIVVSVITFTMANLFNKDKTTYIKSLISTSTVHTAVETRSLFENYLVRIRTFARTAYDSKLTQDEKSRMFDDLFLDFPEMVGIVFYENGEEQASVFDEVALSKEGLTRADLDTRRAVHSTLPLSLEPGRALIKNTTFKTSFPIMTVTTAISIEGHDSPIILDALVRLDNLIAITGRTEELESFILEPGGKILAHKNLDRIQAHDAAGWIPEENLLEEETSMAGTFDYSIGGVDMFGGFAPVEVGNLLVGAQIPQAEAYTTATDLFKNLRLVSLLILLGATTISFFWSYRITRPIEELSRATQEVGRGQFDVQVTPTSHDEIGSLTRSVNKMAFELREREKALKETQAALIQAEKMSAFGQLSAGIAHEVKNPLAGILGYAQLSLKKINEENSAIHKNLTIIEKETRRCNSIIENLMRFARQDKPQLEWLAINDVVEDALTLVDHQLGVNQITAEKNLSADLPEISGDANQLIQVFMNILINAQQAMKGEPGTITVTSNLIDGNTVELRFKDTGPGIPDETRSKIFEPFYTTKAAGEGTGLGLAVTYGIIKDHGGEISVESEPGQGATFIISLPPAGSEGGRDS